MKKKTNIRTLLRTMVREEVAMAIQEVITELKQPTQKVSQPKPKKRVVEKKNYSNNSVINDVLNETAQSDEWKTMGGGTYNSSNINDVLQSSYGNMMSDNTNGNLAASMGINPNEAPDFLTKDYSKLMKAMDKKQGK